MARSRDTDAGHNRQGGADLIRYAVPCKQISKSLWRVSDDPDGCREFCLVDVEAYTGTVKQTSHSTAPTTDARELASWLSDQGVQILLTGHTGTRTQAYLMERGIQVVTGATCGTPQVLAKAFHLSLLQPHGQVLTGTHASDAERLSERSECLEDAA